MCLCTLSLALNSHFLWNQQRFFSTKMACFLFKSSLSLVFFFVYTHLPAFWRFFLLSTSAFFIECMQAHRSLDLTAQTRNSFHIFLWTFTLIIMLCIKWHTTYSRSMEFIEDRVERHSAWKLAISLFSLSRKSLTHSLKRRYACMQAISIHIHKVQGNVRK